MTVAASKFDQYPQTPERECCASRRATLWIIVLAIIVLGTAHSPGALAQGQAAILSGIADEATPAEKPISLEAGADARADAASESEENLLDYNDVGGGLPKSTSSVGGASVSPTFNFTKAAEMRKAAEASASAAESASATNTAQAAPTDTAAQPAVSASAAQAPVLASLGESPTSADEDDDFDLVSEDDDEFEMPQRGVGTEAKQPAAPAEQSSSKKSGASHVVVEIGNAPPAGAGTGQLGGAEVSSSETQGTEEQSPAAGAAEHIDPEALEEGYNKTRAPSKEAAMAQQRGGAGEVQPTTVKPALAADTPPPLTAQTPTAAAAALDEAVLPQGNVSDTSAFMDYMHQQESGQTPGLKGALHLAGQHGQQHLADVLGSLSQQCIGRLMAVARCSALLPSILLIIGILKWASCRLWGSRDACNGQAGARRPVYCQLNGRPGDGCGSH